VHAATATPINPEPYLDEDGLLRVGWDWVSIPDAQVPVIELLLDHPNRVVRLEVIAEVYVSSGGSGQQAAVRSMLNRLGRRVARVGLDLRAVRARGALLTWQDAPRPAVRSRAEVRASVPVG
jgi:hypothetical protein